MRYFLLFLLAWPFVEIAGFVMVGREIGVLATIALTIAMGIVGAALLRYQGFGVVTRIQKEVEAGRNPSRDVGDGAMILLAGALLLLPGFVSDLLGLMLFLPPVREAVWTFLRKRVKFASVSFGPNGRRQPNDGRVIDLDASDYHAGSNPNSPWKQIDDDQPQGPSSRKG